jgi:hypothetical protein
MISRVHVTLRLTVHKFSTSHPYKQTIVNCNNLVIQYKEHLWRAFVYSIVFVLLRTRRSLGIKTCEPTEELGGWLYVYTAYMYIHYCIGTCITCLPALLLTCMNYCLYAYTTASMRTLMHLGIHCFTCAFAIARTCSTACLHTPVLVCVCVCVCARARAYINCKSRVAS